MRNIANTISPEVLDALRENLTYCPETGSLTWKRVLKYNRRKPGDPAGSVRNPKNGAKCGYVYFRSVFTDNKFIAVHRIAWAMAYGDVDCTKCIDHIDGNPQNNRISNLRMVPKIENAHNIKGANKTSKSGIPGVYYYTQTKRWIACIGITTYETGVPVSKRKHLGYFATSEMAYQAYLDAKRKLHKGNTL